jgi:hypothetical protein
LTCIVETAGDLTTQPGQTVPLVQLRLGEQKRGKRERAGEAFQRPRGLQGQCMRMLRTWPCLAVQPVHVMAHAVADRQRGGDLHIATLAVT